MHSDLKCWICEYFHYVVPWTFSFHLIIVYKWFRCLYLNINSTLYRQKGMLFNEEHEANAYICRYV